MGSTKKATSSKDYINQLYDSQISKEKEALTQTYNESISGLDANKEAAEKQKQKELNATAVEAQRAQKNYNEVQSAYGLTFGAMAQARLAQDNQLQADMTAIRTAAADQDAAIERQRSLLSQQYASAIREAQANNDLARAQSLYELAKEEEEAMRKKQLAAAYSSGVGSGAGSKTYTEDQLKAAIEAALQEAAKEQDIPVTPANPTIPKGASYHIPKKAPVGGNTGGSKVIEMPVVKRKPEMIAIA